MESFGTSTNGLIAALAGNPLLATLAALVLVALILEAVLYVRLHLILRGGDGKSLEGTMRKLNDRLATLETHARETTLILKEADERLARAVQGVSVKRFDPFQNAGGQQSFTTALLSEEGDGVVISGIHARDGVRVYAKEVKRFASERELSNEEREAIDEAKKKLG